MHSFLLKTVRSVPIVFYSVALDGSPSALQPSPDQDGSAPVVLSSSAPLGFVIVALTSCPNPCRTLVAAGDSPGASMNPGTPLVSGANV